MNMKTCEVGWESVYYVVSQCILMGGGNGIKSQVSGTQGRTLVEIGKG